MSWLDSLGCVRARHRLAKIAWRDWQKRHARRDLLGVAVLGCGGGGLMHVSHYLWHPDTIVRAVLDVNCQRFADIQRMFPFAAPQIQCTGDFESILSRKDIDIVSVCTPDHTHADYVIAALEAGKHVLCEKPMATTLDDCRRIICAADAARTTFCVFQQMRFVPRHRAIKRLIDSGTLGDIFYAETGYVHDMRRRAAEFSRWRLDTEKFQHPILGGCHHIDLMRWLGDEIQEVYTMGSHKGLPSYPADDTYVTVLRLRNNAVGHILTTFSPRLPRELHRLRFCGTRVL